METGTPVKNTFNIFAHIYSVCIWNVETVHETSAPTCNTKILNKPLGPDGTTEMEQLRWNFPTRNFYMKDYVDLSKLEVMKFFKT